MAFVDSAGHHGFLHAPSDAYVDTSGLPQHQHYAARSTSTSAMQDPAKTSYYNPNLPQSMSCDIKPRLTKEQHDILEAHFQKQQKPSTNIKKGFAETLNVSLDKVNNWFQNRRAKSKQDAKKAAGAYNLYAQQHSSTTNFSSDSDTSPAFSSPDYFAMMQQSNDDQFADRIGMGQMAHFQEQAQPHGLPYASHTTSSEHFNHTLLAPPHGSLDMFDSPLEMNRRTLTQEQFDQFAQNGGIVQATGHFDSLQHGFSGDTGLLHQVFPMHQEDFKQSDDYTFPAPIGAPLSSSDSSTPSTISEQSMFPSSAPMQDHANMSSVSSDWCDSRSSSVSTHGSEAGFPSMPASQAQLAQASSSQWQPGQSVPVDPSDLQRQFSEAQQRAQQHQQAQQQFQDEQPLAWPTDEAFVRRDSHNGTALAEQMSGFAIQTPQPPQESTFRRPAPPQANSASIAARRQRPRPAALSLRSQSYTGAVQPASPSQQASQILTPGQPLRRIRSSNVINGVAQGRVMKSIPGSAQRSPLSFTFADALQSPNIRHASVSSTGNLAPPTPLSPAELQRLDNAHSQFPPWQPTGRFDRQASISESEESSLADIVAAQKVASPPQTPMYQHHPQHQMVQARVGSTVITENTPPQSAPAVQTTFPANAFVPRPQPQPQVNLMQQQFTHPPNQAFISVSVPEPQYQAPAAYPPAQHFAVPAPEPPTHMQMQFAHAVPIVNAQGQLTMAYPSHLQQVQYGSAPQQNMGAHYNFVNVPGPSSPGQNAPPHFPKTPAQPAAELFVHEYSPPSDVKRDAAPRKAPADSGPKNYTFANQTPEHFEKDRAKRDAKSATDSPDSAGSTS